MINITIDKNGKSSPSTINIGNQWENRDEELVFSFPEEFKDFNKYVIAYIKNKKTKEEIRQIFPITNDTFVVSSGVTRYAGSWHLYTLCKESPLDLDSDTVDIRAKNGERISISDSINAIISPNDIGDDVFQNFPMDENIKLIYDELFALKLEFEKADAVREENELARKHEEELRVQAENARVQAEANRVEAENNRTNAEGVRVQSETNRVSAEQSRVSIEKTRVNAERARSEAETSRINAEQSRADAEQLRVSAENERVTAENARAEAESKREGVISKLREDLDSNTKADEKTSRSLTALWDLNNGISYRFENDNGKAYMKTIPSGAKLGAVSKIGGRTIVYNQLFKTDNIDNGSITITYADNIVTINGTTSNNWVNFSELDEKLNVVGKFYIKMIIIKNDDGLSFGYGWLNRNMQTDNITSGSVSAICSQTSSDLEKGLSTGIAWAENTGSVTFNDVKIQITIVNLTKMFGEGNEPTTTEEFESMFPNSYYPYNEGTLMSMSVNEVEEVGKNIFKCEHFSCNGLDDTNKPNLNNLYGTSINNTEPSNSVTVTQSKVANEDNATSYSNGYFCISFKPLTMNGKYVFSFDITPSNKLISSPKFMVLLNGDGNYGSAIADTQSLQIGIKSKLFFTLNVNNRKVKYIEIRNSGVSGIFENFQIEEGSTNTDFSPYHKKAYTIPQAIQSLDGYGWSVGSVYNYVDYENKKFYKCVNRVDLGTLDFIYGTFGNSNEYHIFRTSLISDMKKDENAYLHTNNLLCSRYTDISWSDLWSSGVDKAITQTSNNIGITDSSFTEAEAFKQSLQGVYLYYELAEPIVTDISDIIEDTFQEPFNVESCGSLTFKNTNGDGYQVAVPSEVQYVISLKEVNP